MQAAGLIRISKNSKSTLSETECVLAGARAESLFFLPTRRIGTPKGITLQPFWNLYNALLFNFFAFTFPQYENLLNNSYVDDFTVSCSNSKIVQMACALCDDLCYV